MRRRWVIRGLIALVVLVVAVVVLADTADEGAENDAVPPRVVSVEELREIATEAGGPIYWAGELPDTRIQVTVGTDASALVSYLPPGSDQAGPDAPTIGTYPMPDPEAATVAQAGKEGAIVRDAGEGRIAVSNEASPRSVYFAGPEGSAQVEVYHPSAQRAMQLALSDRVRPVEAE